MIIQNNVSSQNYNSFGINANIETLVTIQKKSDLLNLDFENYKYKYLGGGSNVLITDDVSDYVLKLDVKGKEVIQEGEEYVLVKVSSGENWHETVLWCVENGYGGIENLSLIPGLCGAAPIQNIGAYGVEIKDVLHSVLAFDTDLKVERSFHAQECGLAYRSSHFKYKWKGKYIITDIILKLTKPGFHKINKKYGAIGKTLEENEIDNPTINDVSNAVIKIRSNKLPDPKVIGNAGSFFKNPVVGLTEFQTLLSEFPQMPHYEVGIDYKIPAAWMIEQCGWKGKRIGDTGTYKNQALVIVNHGSASGSDIANLSKDIQNSVLEKFGINLEPEVNFW